MNMDEALQATIMGDRVTHPGLGRDTFVCYEFNGFEHKSKHTKRFGEWASCAFIPSDADRLAEWEVLPFYEPKPREIPSPLAQTVHPAPDPAKWGRPAASVAPPAPPKPATGLEGFLAVQAAPEAAYDPDIEAIAAMPEDAFLAGIAAIRDDPPPAPKRDAWGRPID